MSNKSRSKSQQPADPHINVGQHLGEVCNKIRRHLFLADARPVRSYYEVGRILQDVTGHRARYGDGAVARIADALGVHVSLLYKCQKVAVAFSPAEYGKLCAKRTPGGLPLFTWSHFEVLAAERDPKRRSTLLHNVEQENLSVRELREEKRGAAAPQEQATSRCTPTYIKELHELNRQADELARHEEWSLVLQKIDDDPPPEVLPLLRTALDIQRHVRAENETIVGLLQQALDRAERGDTSPSKPTAPEDSSIRH